MTMNESCDLVVIGSFVQDHTWLTDRFPAVGETLRATGFSTGPGGKGFNQAIAAHRQGARTLFIGAVGDDALGRSAQGWARENGLACRWQVCPGVATAAAGILVDAEGRNQITVALGANEHLQPAFLAVQREAVAGAGVVLVQLENNLDAVAAALALATEVGATAVLNPAPVHPGLAPDLLRQVDLVTPNETEFAQLLDRLAGTAIDPDRVVEFSDDALHAWSRRIGVGTVVITLGANGCFVSHGTGSRFAAGEPDRYRVAAQSVETVDTTGAGDAFNGALAAGLLRLDGQPFRSAVEHANASAALSTSRIGAAAAMPTLAEVVERFG
jgi:ribokinase